MKLSVIILAAGAGTRMHSKRPKVLHEIGGISMLEHVYNTSLQLNATQIQIVYGYGGDTLKKASKHFKTDGFKNEWVEQTQQLGTAHAVQQASKNIDDDAIALVLYGDVPLIEVETLKQLVKKVTKNTIALLTVVLEDPASYGRIVRQKGEVTAITEFKDATEEIKKITEINTGILALNAKYLNQCIAKIDNNNAQKEYYLTDIIALAVNDNNKIQTLTVKNSEQVEGVNDRLQLAKLERVYQRKQAEALLRAGTHLADLNRIDIRGKIAVGKDSSIDINCLFEGDVSIGDNVKIEAGCCIKNSEIGNNCHIKPYSVIDNCKIETGVEIGPFSRLRPNTRLKKQSKVGNFVEIKNTTLGEKSKAGHLSYLGDSEIGNNVNIGAGVITCNYDGLNKHKTIIKDNAFVGSDSQLIAPVIIGENATIGAGSTITKDTEDNRLTLSRSVQKQIKSWQKPKKK